jgi:hypothetical protein
MGFPPESVGNNAETTEKLLGGCTGKGFMPGQSGNISGRPKKKPFTEMFEKIASDPKKMAQVERAIFKGMISGQAVMVPLLKEIIGRLEGKVSQSIEHSGRMTLEQLVCASMEDPPKDDEPGDS